MLMCYLVYVVVGLNEREFNFVFIFCFGEVWSLVYFLIIVLVGLLVYIEV